MVFFIKKICLNENQLYTSSEIILHTYKKYPESLKLLEECVKKYIEIEKGKEGLENFKIIDIHSFDQINEPLIDSILFYRLFEDQKKIHVYQKKTVIIKSTNWTWGISETSVKQFKRICIFEIEEYTKIKTHVILKDENIEEKINENFELVSIGSLGIKIPKQMTIAPMSELIEELKKSDKFKNRILLNND